MATVKQVELITNAEVYWLSADGGLYNLDEDDLFPLLLEIRYFFVDEE